MRGSGGVLLRPRTLMVSTVVLLPQSLRLAKVPHAPGVAVPVNPDIWLVVIAGLIAEALDLHDVTDVLGHRGRPELLATNFVVSTEFHPVARIEMLLPVRVRHHVQLPDDLLGFVG